MVFTFECTLFTFCVLYAERFIRTTNTATFAAMVTKKRTWNANERLEFLYNTTKNAVRRAYNTLYNVNDLWWVCNVCFLKGGKSGRRRVVDRAGTEHDSSCDWGVSVVGAS